ncbi:MAG: hypothetical protein WA888_10440 [Burkholderiaceae bacterium]
MNLTQLISILKARSGTALTIFALIVGAALLATILIPKKYVASTDVIVDLKPDPVNGGLPSGLTVRPYLNTQADIISSERLRLMVVDRFNLGKNPDYIDGLPDDAPQSSARQYAAEKLAKNLKIDPSRESTMLTISYRSTEPQTAADMANAFAQAFIDTNIEMRTKPATQRRDWFISQGNELRERLNEAQNKLVAYQRKNNIVTADESRDVNTQRFETLSAALTQASSEASDLSQRVDQARQAIAANKSLSIPEVIASPAILSLKAEQARLRASYGQQLAVYGKNHPLMRSLGSELWSVSKRITDEVQTIVASLEKSRDSARARQARLKKELASDESTLLGARNYREELSLLQRDIDNAQRAYDSAQEQLSQTNLQSASTYANLFVLSPALAPGRASSPNLLINLLAAIAFATVMAIGICLIMEMRDRRIYSNADMAKATGGPVIGHLSRDGSISSKTGNPVPQA